MEPFTVEHFRAWALELELDNGERWVVPGYFEAFLEDYFAGVQECWLIVPEGNAKTTCLAGLAVYLLEFRKNAQIPWAASSRDQAEIGYTQAAVFVKNSPRLSKLLKCQDGYRRIKRTDSIARLQVFAADASTGDGIIPTDAFIDELHRHKDLRLYRTWSGKLLKRGGQLATISTAGEVGGEFEETRERIRQETPRLNEAPGYTHCRSDRVAFHEYALPEGGDHEDMPSVKLGNPFDGITVDTLAVKYDSPTMTLEHWLRLTCNRAARGGNAAIEEGEWFGALTDEPFPQGGCWLGADFGWKWDTSAFVPLAWRGPEDRLLGPTKVLVPPRDGSMLHPDEVKRALYDLKEQTRFHTVVMDSQDAEDIAAWIKDELGVTVIDRPQGNVNAVDDYAKFMEALRNGWLKHTGDPDLTRHALNAITRRLPLGDPRFDRPSTTRQGGNQDLRVIDALVAAAMANSAASVAPPPKPRLFVGTA